MSCTQNDRQFLSSTVNFIAGCGAGRRLIFQRASITSKLGPRREDLIIAISKVSVDEELETPAYVEVFERYNPTGQIISMVLAEIEVYHECIR